MGKWKNAPPLLKRKILLTVLVGIGCLLVGIAMCVFSKDTMMLFLSLAVCGFSFFKAYTMYHVVAKNEYEVVEGTCINYYKSSARSKLRIMMVMSLTLLLAKQSKIKIGDRYRFYFKNTTRVTLGNEYFDSALSSDCFLGYEAISG